MKNALLTIIIGLCLACHADMYNVMSTGSTSAIVVGPDGGISNIMKTGPSTAIVITPAQPGPGFKYRPHVTSVRNAGMGERSQWDAPKQPKFYAKKNCSLCRGKGEMMKDHKCKCIKEQEKKWKSKKEEAKK